MALPNRDECLPVPMPRLDTLTLHRLRVPLMQPYRLSFGAVTHYDTLIVEATGCDGRHGLGEATVLTGYTDETIDDCWRVAGALARELAGCDAVAAHERLAVLAGTHPFTATAFGTALEMIEGSALLTIERTTPVPLLGLLDAKDPAAMEAEVERLLAAGYRTLKLKVGFDAAKDAGRVTMAQRAVRGRAGIRIDANQGYSAADGVAFARALDPAGIELFEQPCAAGDWESHLAVARVSAAPMMLDESIYGLADIERAATLKCAAYIKLKLMKLGTLAELKRAIERVRELGMKPVLGNGVACDLGCWLEALVAARHIDNAGEMNGFLKPPSGLLAQPIEFRDGALMLEPGYVPTLAPEALARYRIEAVTCTPSRTQNA